MCSLSRHYELLMPFLCHKKISPSRSLWRHRMSRVFLSRFELRLVIDSALDLISSSLLWDTPGIISISITEKKSQSGPSNFAGDFNKPLIRPSWAVYNPRQTSEELFRSQKFEICSMLKKLLTLNAVRRSCGWVWYRNCRCFVVLICRKYSRYEKTFALKLSRAFALTNAGILLSIAPHFTWRKTRGILDFCWWWCKPNEKFRELSRCHDKYSLNTQTKHLEVLTTLMRIDRQTLQMIMSAKNHWIWMNLHFQDSTEK
jgi:hypothetical protein